MDLNVIRRLEIRASTQGVDQATEQLQQLGQAQGQVATTSETMARVTETSSRRQLSAASAVDRLRSSMDATYRAQQQLARGQAVVDRAFEQSAIDTAQAAQMHALLQQRYQATVVAGTAVATSTQLTVQQMAQMQFQLQDIAVSLASGQSPFMVLMQQGSQMAQSFAAGTGVRGALAAVGAGIVSFLTNPLNLAVLAFSAAVGAVTWFFSAVGSGSSDAEQALERHKEIVDAVAQAYRDAGKDTDGWVDKIAGVTQLQAAANIEQQRESLRAAVEELRSLTTTNAFNLTAGLTGPMGEGFSQIREFTRMLAEGKIEARDYSAALDRIGQTSASPAVRELALDLQNEAQAVADAEQRTREAEASLRLLSGTATDADRAVLGLTGSVQQLATGLAGLRGAVPAMAEAMRAQQELGQASRDFAKAQADIETMHRAGEIGSADRAAEMENLNRTYRAAVSEITGVAEAQRKANTELDQFVASGRLAGMNAHEQAVARLRTRYEELREQMQAGDMSQGAFDAAKQALDQQMAALDEQYDAQGNRIRAGSKPPISDYQREVDAIRERTEALKIDANVFGLSTYAAERYRAEQQLLAAATASSIPVTDTLREKIAGIADEYAKAAAQAEQQREQQQQLIQRMDSLRSGSSGFLSGFLNDLRTGTSLTQALGNAFDSLAAKLMDMAAQNLVWAIFGGQGTSGGGLLGDIIGSWFGGGGSAGSAAGASPAGALPGGGPPSVNGGSSRSAATAGEARRFNAAAHNAGGEGGVVLHYSPVTNIDARGAQQGVAASLAAELDRRDARLKAEVPGLVERARRNRQLRR